MFGDKKKRVDLSDWDTYDELYTAVNNLISSYCTLKNALDDAHQFGLSQDILNDIEGKMEYIEMIMKPYSIEGIKDYLISLKNQSKNVLEKRCNIQKNHKSNLRSLGLSEEFYETSDVDEFFSSSLTLEEFLNKIIIHEIDIDCDFFQKHLIESIKNRTTANCITYNLSCSVAYTIVSIIARYSKLYNSLSNKKVSLVDSVLANEEIEEAVLKISDTNIIRELLDDVNKAYDFSWRIQTDFYYGLPMELRKKLKLEMENVGEGEIYSRMFDFYKNKKVLPSDDIADVEQEKDKIDKEIEKFYNVIMRAVHVLEKSKIKEKNKNERTLNKRFSKILGLLK